MLRLDVIKSKMKLLECQVKILWLVHENYFCKSHYACCLVNGTVVVLVEGIMVI